MKLLLAFGLALTLAVPAVARPYVPRVEPIEVPPATQPPTVEAPEDVPQRPLAAEEAARIALRHYANVRVAAAQAEAAAGRTDQVASTLRPHLNLGANANLVLIEPSLAGELESFASGGSSTVSTNTAGTPSVSSSSSLSGISSLGGNSASFSGSVSQLIWDFNHTRELVRQDRDLKLSADYALSRVQHDLIYTAKQAFYGFAQTQRLVRVQEDNVSNRRVHLAQAQSRFKAGLGLPVDVTRAESALAQAVGNLTQAQADVTISRVNLDVQLGLDPRTPVQVEESEEPDILIEDPRQLYETALRQRPEMLQSVANVSANNHAVSAAATTSAPTVNGNLAYNGQLLSGLGLTNSLSLVFSVNFQAYDGGLQGGRVREARANRVAARASLEAMAQTIISDVSQSYVNLRTAGQRLRTTAIAENSARESVRLAEGRYRVGLGIFLDLLDAQSALLSAQLDRVNAQTSVNLARIALAHALGAPLPTP